jgi:hypothetical protein
MAAKDDIDRCKKDLRHARMVLAALIHKLGGFVKIEPHFVSDREPRKLKVWVTEDGALNCMFRRTDPGY